MVYGVAIRRDILDFSERGFATLRGGGIEKEMGIIALVKPGWNHHSISDFQRMSSGEYVLSLVSLFPWLVSVTAILPCYGKRSLTRNQ